MAKINPGNLEAQQLVQQLHGRGLSYSEIGRLVGRDSSYISQIGRKGNKGASLVPSLKQIEQGELDIKQPERRTTKAGTAAKVRGKPETNVMGEVRYQTKKGAKTMEAVLRDAAKNPRLKVGIGIKFSKVKTISDRTLKNSWVVSPGSQHVPAQQILDRASEMGGDVLAAMRSILLEQTASRVTSASGPQEYKIFINAES